MIHYYKLREEIKKYLEQEEIATGIIDLIGVISVTAKEVISERNEGIDHEEKKEATLQQFKYLTRKLFGGKIVKKLNKKGEKKNGD